MKVFEERAQTSTAHTPDRVADEPHGRVLGMPGDLTEVTAVNHYVAVAYKYVGISGFSIGRNEIVNFRIKSRMALLDDEGYIPIGIFVLNFFCYFIGRIIEVLEAEEDFVFGIVLSAET